MKPICLLFVLPLLGTGCRTEQSAYLEKALSQLERIERVAYRRSSESYLPGDTIPRRYLRYYVEQRNRADTTLRHSYLSYYNADDTTRIDGGYDGTIAVDLDHDRREVVIDDFSIPRAPYRLTDMTFFCRAEAILRCNVAAIFFSICMLRHLLTNKIKRQLHPVNADFSTFVTSFRHIPQKAPFLQDPMP